MSELADTIAALKAQQAQLDELAANDAAQSAKLSQHDQALAEIDRTEKHMVALIEGLRDQVIEGFRRMRLGINGR